MADSNVVALPGSDIPRADGEADPEVVRMLEERLEAVRRGELVAVAIAGVHRGRVRSDGFACASNHQNDLAAATARLARSRTNTLFCLVSGARPRRLGVWWNEFWPRCGSRRTP